MFLALSASPETKPIITAHMQTSSFGKYLAPPLFEVHNKKPFQHPVFYFNKNSSVGIATGGRLGSIPGKGTLTGSGGNTASYTIGTGSSFSVSKAAETRS